MKDQKFIVSVSGGAGSTIALERCIEKHGYKNTIAIFADTKSEHGTLYKLLDFIEERHPELELIRLSDGRDIWDVFDESGIIKTPKFGACKASLELKQKPIAQWVRDNCDPSFHILVSGLEWTEPERIERFSARWEPYQCWHPLTDAPILSNCQVKDAIKDLGYPTQSLYERRYPHNNCGGACVLAGMGQWAGLREDDPELFKYSKEREAQFNALHRQGKKPFTVLKDQSAKPIIDEDGNMSMKKKSTPISLVELEQRILTNDVNLRDFRSSCGCYMGEQVNFFDILDGCDI